MFIVLAKNKQTNEQTDKQTNEGTNENRFWLTTSNYRICSDAFIFSLS